ncbi:MAG: nitric oxide reductase transcriptional regulator NorR [Kangiellaceae bacterium]|nr:nitric oxide reductase transcriptional regulator NorR [Kangiellaceae bacterium]
MTTSTLRAKDMITSQLKSDSDVLSALLSIAVDLTNSLTSAERFERLLVTSKKFIPCDAAAILRLKEGILTPLVVDGLHTTTRGKRFRVSHHPRFESILNASGVVKFDKNSKLPDPYDGLVESCEGNLPVHACMGAPLIVGDNIWGIITFDALNPDAFDSIDEDLVATFCAFAAAAASSASFIEKLESTVNKQTQVSENLIQQVLNHQHQEMIGESQSMQQLKKEIAIVAPSDLNVLISGETGTGKELVSLAIHQNSNRSDQPIVYLNCSSLPENLAESELFGHRRGAFTGAVKDYKGKFELADGGTLFLDEIGELPLNLQAKLLRVLQSGEVQAIGDEKIKYVDVRVIAATNRNLKDEVVKGNFRLDLFQRLSVYPISVPPLRERTGDIPLLAAYFIEKLARKYALQGVSLEPSAIDSLLVYQWPGNVRELEHLINRVLLKLSINKDARLNRISHSDLQLPQVSENWGRPPLIETGPAQLGKPQFNSNETGKSQSLSLLTDKFQKSIIEQQLLLKNGNWSKAAKALGLDRSNLHRLAKRLGLK